MHPYTVVLRDWNDDATYVDHVFAHDAEHAGEVAVKGREDENVSATVVFDGHILPEWVYE